MSLPGLPRGPRPLRCRVWSVYGFVAAGICAIVGRLIWPEGVWFWTVLVFVCSVGLAVMGVSLVSYARRALGAAHQTLKNAEIINDRIEEKLHDLQVIYFLIDPGPDDWYPR